MSARVVPSRGLRRAAVRALLVAMVACEAAPDVAVDSPAPAEAADVAAGPLITFRVRPGEREGVMAALQTFAEQRPDHDLREARLYRFSVDSASGRYLLLAPMSGLNSQKMRSWGLSFSAVLTGDTTRISRPYSFGGLEVITIEAVRDLDGDAEADVVFCGSYEGQDEPSVPRALGYRNGKWYEIALASAASRRATREIACQGMGGEERAPAGAPVGPPRDTSDAVLQA